MYSYSLLMQYDSYLWPIFTFILRCWSSVFKLPSQSLTVLTSSLYYRFLVMCSNWPCIALCLTLILVLSMLVSSLSFSPRKMTTAHIYYSPCTHNSTVLPFVWFHLWGNFHHVTTLLSRVQCYPMAEERNQIKSKDQNKYSKPIFRGLSALK